MAGKNSGTPNREELADKQSRLSPERKKYWKDRGFLLTPKSEAQAQFAWSAHEFVGEIGISDKIAEMLNGGKRLRDVCELVRETCPKAKVLSWYTVNKYLNLYRRYFVPPFVTIEAAAKGIVREYAGKGGHKGAAKLIEAIESIEEKREEIAEMSRLVQIQKDRIDRFVILERQMNLPIPTLRGEIETQLRVLEAIVTKKMELGLPGWQIAPKEAVLTHRLQAPIDQLKPEERAKVVEVTKKILNAIELTKSQNGTYGPAAPESE